MGTPIRTATWTTCPIARGRWISTSQCRTPSASVAPTVRSSSGASAAAERRRRAGREGYAQVAQVEIQDSLIVRSVAIGADSLRRLAYSDPEAFPVLLDSAESGPRSRYSILAAYPQAALWQDGRGRLHATGMP